MAYQDDDISGKIARIEERQKHFQESLNRHEEQLTEIRGDFKDAVEKFTGEISSVKTRILGAAVAAGIIVALINLLGVAFAIYASVK